MLASAQIAGPRSPQKLSQKRVTFLNNALVNEIRDGWYVLAEPNGEPRVGEYVLVKLNSGQKMVKELLNRRLGSYEVMSVNGGERMTYDTFDIESVQAVGAVVSPSKWRPE